MVNENLGGTLAQPTDSFVFKFTGGEVRVPTLTLFHLDIVGPDIQRLGPDLDWVTYAKLVIHIMAAVLEKDEGYETEIHRGCSMADIRSLPRQMNGWLEASGFLMGEATPPVEGASPGTGTLPPSPQNSQPTGSAPETSTGSKEVIH